MQLLLCSPHFQKHVFATLCIATSLILSLTPLHNSYVTTTTLMYNKRTLIYRQIIPSMDLNQSANSASVTLRVCVWQYVCVRVTLRVCAGVCMFMEPFRLRSPLSLFVNFKLYFLLVLAWCRPDITVTGR